MTPQQEQELNRTTALRGFRYGFHDLLAEVDLDALRRSNDQVEAEYGTPLSVDRKTRELLFLAVGVAQQNEVAHLQVHMHAAVNAGSSEEELWQILVLIRSWIGLPSAIKGFEAWRATFRPDIPPVDRVVEVHST